MITQKQHPSIYDANCTESCISEEDNIVLTTTPTLKDIKDTVFSIDTDSAPGPDGFSGYFYQRAWDIIASDLHKAVIAVFFWC